MRLTETEVGAGNAAAFVPERDDVFARIAGRYDRLCDIFSLLIHRRWKAYMASRIARFDGGRILDVASGTGDIPVRVVRQAKRRHREIDQLIVTDICPQMLDMARRKLEGKHPALSFSLQDAHSLSHIDSGSVDLFSISFAMKICDRERVLREAMRVLRPGGSFFCLEAARIPLPPVHRVYLAYMRWCLPLIGRLAANGDSSAYEYFLKGIHDFPDQAVFAAELESAGFTDVSYRNLTFGIVALHEGRKPGSA